MPVVHWNQSATVKRHLIGVWGSLRRTLCWVSLLCWAAVAMPQTHVPLDAKWGRFEGATDHSFLNQTITAQHAITVVGAHFKTLGPDLEPNTPDDVRVRLFGVSLSREGCFPATEKQATDTATTLRSLGFNAVRLHQMDTAPSSDPDSLQSTLTLDPYPTLHEGAVARLRHFIGALKAEGIYVNLNLMVGYAFRPQVDGVPALDDQGTAPAYGSPVHVFYPRMVDLQVQYAEKLLKALKLKNDPVLAQVEVINESSLAAAWLHWDQTYWVKQIRGAYAQTLDQQWQAWVSQRHGSMEEACKAWGTCEQETGRMLTPTEADALQHAVHTPWLLKLKQKLAHWWSQLLAWLGLPEQSVPSVQTVHPKVRDALMFVSETDRVFLEKMRQVVHTATRPNLPVAGTQADFGAPLNFRSHEAMDYVDAHFYVDHPEFPGAQWSDTDWRFRNESVSGREISQLLSVAAFRDARKPFVISEFNQPYPNSQGHDVLPVTAAVAAQQDWDGLYYFSFDGSQSDRITPNHFNLQGDWPKTSVVGLSARIFRTASLPPLPSRHWIGAQSDDWWSSVAMERRPDTWTRHLSRQRLWDVRDVLSHQVAIGHDEVSAQSAPTLGQLVHDESERRVVFSSPQVSGVFGELASNALTRVDQLAVRVQSSAPREAVAVLLHSLDGLPINGSRHLLLSTPAMVSGTQPGSVTPRPQKRIPYRGEGGAWTLEPVPPHLNQPSGPRVAIAPLWLERKPLLVTLDSGHSQLTVYPLSPTGHRLPALPSSAVKRIGQSWELQLNQVSEQTALWFEMVLS